MKDIVINHLMREVDSSVKHLSVEDCEKVFNTLVDYLYDQISLLDLDENEDE